MDCFHSPLQQTRQQSSTELEEMKVGVEELKERIVEADKAIAEITASMAELEKQKSKVHHVHLPGNINFHRIVPTKIMQGLFHNFV